MYTSTLFSAHHPPTLHFPFCNAQVSTLVSLGQVQTEEGYSSDAVETYLRVLALQEDEDSDEVADAHVQASGLRSSSSQTHRRHLVDNYESLSSKNVIPRGSMACLLSPLRTAVYVATLNCSCLQVAISMLDSHNHSEAVGHLELATGKHSTKAIMECIIFRRLRYE